MANRFIPSNYNTPSMKTRNIIEAVIFDAIYLGILAALHLGTRPTMYLAVVILPVTVFTIIGIGGQSLTQALAGFIRFLRHKRVLSKPTDEYVRAKRKRTLLNETNIKEKA